MEKPFERWNSSDGLKVLRLLAERKSAAPSVFRDLDLQRWERAMLRRALRAPKGFASLGPAPIKLPVARCTVVRSFVIRTAICFSPSTRRSSAR
jgi:hypothetical protein